MIILGLGSNIGDRLAYLTAAVNGLEKFVQELKLSRVLESEALLPECSTPDMNKPFLNMAVAGICNLPPDILLHEIKQLEQQTGRIERCKWGPREIDIDILAFDDFVYKSYNLSIPHSELLNRDFALVALADVAPDWVYPVEGVYHGKTATEILANKKFGLNDKLQETGLSLDV